MIKLRAIRDKLDDDVLHMYRRAIVLGEETYFFVCTVEAWQVINEDSDEGDVFDFTLTEVKHDKG